MKEYFDLEHARMRLGASTIGLDDTFVSVDDLEQGAKRGEYRMHYRPLEDPDSPHRMGYIPHQKIRTDNLILGFVNYETNGTTQPIFLQRIPYRMYKEGITHNNLAGTTIQGNSVGRATLDYLRRSQHLLKTLQNKYPSYEEVVEATKKIPDGYGVAFSRNFATNAHQDLIYRRGTVVGIVGKEPILKDSFFYLKELLEKELH